MAKEVQKIVEGLGLSEAEARVYLACLEIGAGTNTQIARISTLNRITNYEILKRLRERGVATEVAAMKVKKFSVMLPDVLIRMSKEKVAAAEEALPSLLALSSNNVRPKVSFYEGIEGI